MATLGELKLDLRAAVASSERNQLSQAEYETGFSALLQGTTVYEDFVHPQLSRLLAGAKGSLSVLEIGPGPKTTLAALPDHLKRQITRYVAFEPNANYAASLEDALCRGANTTPVLPGLGGAATVHRTPFSLCDDSTSHGPNLVTEKYDLVLFCHSMYGMSPKRKYIEKALRTLKETSEAKVIVFHRNENLDFDGLVCQQTAALSTGVARLLDEDSSLDSFAAFIAGTSLQDAKSGDNIRLEWRKICRGLSRKEQSGHLLFRSPELMVTFTYGSMQLQELEAKVPRSQPGKIKNPEARLCRPASVVRPTEIGQVQDCVQWALKHHLALALLGGSHGGHCIVDNVDSIDMSAFDQIRIVRSTGQAEADSNTQVVVGAGVKSGEIVRQTMAEGLTVPLGSRPSVGAGLWLQGGFGHLSRLHGLTCDAIVGAVLVSVVDARVLVVGEVPDKHLPHNPVRPENADELLWALKGAGTNFGIVTSVVFQSVPASTFLTTNWKVPVSDEIEAQQRIDAITKVAAGLYVRNSIDMYLYWNDVQLTLGVTLYEAASSGLTFLPCTPTTTLLRSILDHESDSAVVDGFEVFESEMYMSGMHGGHRDGKTSSFKRCVFLRDVGSPGIASTLVSAMVSRSSPLCYLHLLQGGGAISCIKDDTTAFGFRDRDYACVITGVWERKEDGTAVARAAVDWVYGVVKDLLPLSSGIYGADLGPDPRDTNLAAHAFGLNQTRLGRLKSNMDPHNVLAYACPLPDKPLDPKLIILVTGHHGAGKDYCAAIWNEFLNEKGVTARTVSISDVTKQEYAASTGASYENLLHDRSYKEEYRSALTRFYNDQLSKQPDLPQEHFKKVVHGNAGGDALLITGMRDDSPVASFSNLAPYSRVLEVHVSASDNRIRYRAGLGPDQASGASDPSATTWQPDFIFDNEANGDGEAKKFAERRLLPFFHSNLTRLADMVRSVPDFPSAGVQFHHILNITRQRDGLALCTALCQSLFPHHWTKTNLIASCESGGIPFASALATHLNVPLALIRKAGKLPPPTFSVTKSSSYISSLTDKPTENETFEIDRYAVAKDSSVVVVDDVLSSGRTLCAVLQLLQKAGVKADDISVMVVAEFPVHCGRELLRKSGFGQVSVRSLLVYGGT